jgi:MYXO-CTERM domain-containing protein
MAPRTASALAPLLLLALPTASLAADTPATHQIAAEPSEPEKIDLPEHALEIRTVPRPASAQTFTTDMRPKHLGAKILFVNFDGGNMNACGNNDPHDNCTTIFPGTVLPFSGDAAIRASIIQVVRKRVEDFGITVTDTRPGSGDYDMEMVGNWQGSSPDFAGIAPGGDCWDNDGGETSFTLEVGTGADSIAEIMLQELAHTWGLDHVDEQQDLLFPTTQGTNKTFRDECYQIVSDTDLNPTSGFCSHHQQACGTNSQQNSYAEMLLIHGESIPDTTPPNIGILEPGDGDTIEGDTFNLVLGLQDDQQPAVINTTITIAGGTLPEPFVDDAAFASPTETLSLPINGLPDGEYTITLEATDESDNPATPDSITITIEGSGVGEGEDSASADDSGGEGGTDGGGTDGDGGADDDGDDGDDDGGDDGSGSDAGLEGGGRGTDRGCACAHDHAGSGSLALLVGLFGLLARRRRVTD